MSSALPPPPPPAPYTPQPTLTIEEEAPFLQFIIGRFDGFFDSIHNKANFWLAFNTFSLGGLIAGYKDFVAPLCNSIAVRLLDGELFLFLLANLTSTVFIVLASLPYLKRRESPPLPSAVFFVDVAASTRDDWHRHLDVATLESLRIDQREQAHELAIGLARKYERLNWGGIFLLVQVAIVFFLCITYALKPACPSGPIAPAPVQHVVVDAPVTTVSTSACSLRGGAKPAKLATKK